MSPILSKLRNVETVIYHPLCYNLEMWKPLVITVIIKLYAQIDIFEQIIIYLERIKFGFADTLIIITFILQKKQVSRNKDINILKIIRLFTPIKPSS